MRREFGVAVSDSPAGPFAFYSHVQKPDGSVLEDVYKRQTHNYIFNEVWGSPTASDTPSLRVFMATLRKKLERDPGHPQYIQTHIGVGYRMIRQKPADESV